MSSLLFESDAQRERRSPDIPYVPRARIEACPQRRNKIPMDRCARFHRRMTRYLRWKGETNTDMFLPGFGGYRVLRTRGRLLRSRYGGRLGCGNTWGGDRRHRRG